MPPVASLPSSSNRNPFLRQFRRRRRTIEIGRSRMMSDDGSPFQDCHRDSLQKRRVAENPASSPANAFWQRKQMTDSTSIEQWMANRKKKLLQHQGRHAVDQRTSCVAYFDRQGHEENFDIHVLKCRGISILDWQFSTVLIATNRRVSRISPPPSPTPRRTSRRGPRRWREVCTAPASLGSLWTN